MEVNSLGTAYFDEYRLSAPAVNGDKNFAEILKKAASVTQNDTASLAGSGSADSSSNKNVSIDKTSKLYEQCLELETFLVKNLISSMRTTVQKSGFIDEGFAGKMYEDMLYDEYAKDFTKNANFGLADQAYLELTGQRGNVIIR